MKRRSPFVCWLCIVTYFWVAMGIAEAAQLDAVMMQHSRSSVIVDSSSDATLVIHHVGHRDTHEPHGAESNDRLLASNDSTADPLADHVINLNCSQEFSGLTVKDIKPPQLLALAAICNSAVACWSAARPVTSRPAINSIPNPNTASIKLARLRI